MKKKWLIGVISFVLFLIICTLIYFFYFKVDARYFITKKDFTDSSLVQSTKAIVYFSTTADQDLGNTGLSYAVLIDSKGNAKSLKMNGLELGTVFKGQDTIFLEEKNKVHLIDKKGIHTVTMPTSEHTGEVTTFNKTDGRFYSVYNSGFTKDGSRYQSNIRIGNNKGFETIQVPYYLHSSGITDSELLMLTVDEETFEATLRKMPLQNEVDIKDVASLGSLETNSVLSSILYADGYYYIVMFNSEKMKSEIHRVNEKTKELDIFPLFSYNNAEAFRVRIPYNLRNAAAIVDDKLLFVDGIGEVLSFNIKTEETSVLMELEGASKGQGKMYEQMYIQNDNLYFFRYDEKEDSYTIDTYNLRTGKLETKLPILGLNEIFKRAQVKSKRLASYDLIVVE